MNNENVVANPLVTQQPIPPSDLKRRDFFHTHKSLNFSDLVRRSSFHSEDTDDFIHHKGITFQEHVGRQLMTGNELLYYPELARKLLQMHDYPTLKRSYKVNENIKGLDFLKYFYEYANERLNEFQVEFKQLSNQVDEFIDLYGQDRYLPLINNLEFVRYNETNSIKSQAVIVNGVKWPVSEKNWEKPKNCSKNTEYLNLYQLLNISSEVEYLFLEDFMIDTPFIQIRLAKTWRHKGYTKWYSLDTCQPVSKAEAIRWKKPV